MKVATWNVNSLRVRLPSVLEWTAAEQPDVIALQETKLIDDDFPVAAIEGGGYRMVYSGEKTYNGVAILSGLAGSDVVKDLPGFGDPDRRFLGVTYGDVRVLDVYVPNGAFVGSEKYAYKLAWLDRLTSYLREQLEAHPRLVLVGDFNVAPEDRDCHDPEAWRGQVLFSEPERAAFQRLLETGLADAFRLFDQPPGQYTWWDYRLGCFRRNRGLRIDHVLVSPALRERCTSCRIDRGPRGGQRPSDHAPVVAEFEG